MNLTPADLEPFKAPHATAMTTARLPRSHESRAASPAAGEEAAGAARMSETLLSDAFLQRAAPLWGRGFSVIPLLERGKKPAIPWADYQQRVPTMDEVGDWAAAGRDFNIGIVCGAVSGIVAIDCDSPEAIAWADEHLPATEMRTRTGGGGEHRFFRHPGIPVRNKVKIQTDQARLALDVRGDHGFCVAPGSVHETGTVYEKLGTWPDVEALPVFDPAWIATPPTTTSVPARPVALPGRRTDHDHLLRRARAYVASVPPAVEGQGGDAHTFQLACKLVRGFALSESAAFDLLREWNQTCVPPWTDRELEEKIDGASKYGTETVGARAADRPVNSPRAGSFDTCEDHAPRPADDLTLTSLHTLLAEPDDAIDWIVDGLIAAGSMNMLAGKPKAGKSTLARQLAFCLATGTPFLGHACLAGPIWYLVLEDKRSEVRRHFRLLGATGQEPVRFFFGNTQNLLGKLTRLADLERPRCIMVDTLQRLIFAKDLNDYAEVTTRLEPVLALARTTNAAILLLHHAAKVDRAGIDAVLGSTALTGSVDNVFLLNRTERYRVVSSVQRIGSDLEETVITLDDTGRAKSGQSRHRADVDYLQAALLQALTATTGLTREQWLDAVEGRKTVKLESLRQLLASGTIKCVGTGKKNDPFRYAVTNSGSQVPLKSREPESSFSTLLEFPKTFAGNGGSQVPTLSDGGSRATDLQGERS